MKATVYLGSSLGDSPIFAEAAYNLGRSLAVNGISVIYGGACVGTMNSLAEGALSAGGEVIGVIPEGFKGKKSYQDKKIEVCHHGLTKLYEVRDMSERKQLMAELGDCCIALPGSYGTLDELFEYIVNTQLGFQNKPVYILNLEGYYDPIVDMIKKMEKRGFLKGYDLSIIHFFSNVDQLVESLLVQ